MNIDDMPSLSDVINERDGWRNIGPGVYVKEVAEVSEDPRLMALEDRRVRNIGEQVDNASLHAGSPMFYYCRCCGRHVATLPETWYASVPPKYCGECQPLIDDNVVDDDYDSWLRARGERPVPR